MAAKKPVGIPLHAVMKGENALSPYRRKLHRAARESLMSTDGKISLQDAIEEEYAQLAEGNHKHRATQSAKASKPRGAGDDGTTMGELVIAFERSHMEETAREAWPHFASAIEDWAGPCERVGSADEPTAYRYPFERKQDRNKEQKRTISYNRFRELFGKARAARKG